MPFTTQGRASILSEDHQKKLCRIIVEMISLCHAKLFPRCSDILKWKQNLMEYGNVDYWGWNRRPSARPRTNEKVRWLFQSNRSLSIWTAAMQLGVPISTVHRILSESLFLFPYKLQNLLETNEMDKEKRLDFAKHYSSVSDRYFEYLSRINSSDECMFKISGDLNKKNLRIWGNERPMEHNLTVLNSPGFMTWCAISNEPGIGPYCFERDNVTGETYWSILINYAFPRFRSLNEDCIFQQSDVRPHCFNRLKAYSYWMVLYWWIAIGGPVFWR